MDPPQQIQLRSVGGEEGVEVRLREKEWRGGVRPQSGLMRSGIISNPKLTRSVEYLGDSSSSLDEAERLTEGGGPAYGVEEGGRKGSFLLGLLLSLFASFAFSLGSVVLKWISEEYSPYSLSLWTFQGILLPSLTLLIYQKWVRKKPVFQGVWPPRTSPHPFNLSLLLVRGLLGAGGTVLKVYSLQYMTAADSTVITFSSPVFVILVAWLFLREDCGLVPLGTSVVVLLGVGLITRPPWITGEKTFDTELLTGCLMAFSCMLLGAVAVVILRYLRNVHHALITVIYGLVGTAVSLALSFLLGGPEAPKCLKHWLYALAVASLTFVGQSSLTLAFKYEEAGPIATVRTSEIIFIFGWQFLLLRLVPDWLSIVGGVVVVVGVLVVGARTSVRSLPGNHTARTACAFLLW